MTRRYDFSPDETVALVALGVVCALLSVWALQVGLNLLLAHHDLGRIGYGSALAVRGLVWMLVRSRDEQPDDDRSSTGIAGRALAHPIMDWMTVAVIAIVLEGL